MCVGEGCSNVCDYRGDISLSPRGAGGQNVFGILDSESTCEGHF